MENGECLRMRFASEDLGRELTGPMSAFMRGRMGAA